VLNDIAEELFAACGAPERGTGQDFLEFEEDEFSRLVTSIGREQRLRIVPRRSARRFHRYRKDASKRTAEMQSYQSSSEISHDPGVRPCRKLAYSSAVIYVVTIVISYR
jgi:hypothetical protein